MRHFLDAGGAPLPVPALPRRMAAASPRTRLEPPPRLPLAPALAPGRYTPPNSRHAHGHTTSRCTPLHRSRHTGIAGSPGAGNPRSTPPRPGLPRQDARYCLSLVTTPGLRAERRFLLAQVSAAPRPFHSPPPSNWASLHRRPRPGDDGTSLLLRSGQTGSDDKRRDDALLPPFLAAVDC